MSTLTPTLKKLGSRAIFPEPGRAARRWGQILREVPEITHMLAVARANGQLVPLADLADVRSGVVTRANAYFVVRELPLAEIPDRFRITKRDYEHVAVIEDGLKSLHRIERICLRSTIKGPEALHGPSRVITSDQRVFDVGERSKEDLRDLRANGALTYLKRGETHPYSVSEDRLKGGIPAQRSQVKNRKPYWYSLHSPDPGQARVAVPEHFDSRFIATLLPKNDDAVVIDTLYSVIPERPAEAQLIHLSLNSLLTWYQLELRGRTQHGEGVLKVKIADYDGLLVLNPRSLSRQATTALLKAFKSLHESATQTVAQELLRPDRVAFDQTYVSACGIEQPETVRLLLERELRAAMSERRERARSVDDAKAGSSVAKRVTASVDAYASRIAAALGTFPDPRDYSDDETGEMILISTPFEGSLTIGNDLFTQGQVLAGDQTIASAGDTHGAQYVRGVLVHDPEVAAVQLPNELTKTIERWEAAIVDWQVHFDKKAEATLTAIADNRLRDQIRQRALVLLHAR